MENIKKLTKSDNLLLIIGVILFVVSALFIYAGYDETKKSETLPKFLDSEKEDSKVSLEVDTSPYAVATNDDETEAFAIVADKDNVLYLIKSNINKLKNIYDKNADNDTVILKGVLKTTPDNIIGFTIDSYNEYIEEELITEDNFEDYFGPYYLDMDELTDDSIVFYVFAAIFIIGGAICVISSSISKKNTQKTINSELYPVAATEAENPELLGKSAILTKNFVIFNERGLKIVKYDEITWIYRHTYTYNGIPSQYLAFYVKGSKKVKMIHTGMKADDVTVLMEQIAAKNPNVLVGFTNENREKNKTLI